MDYEDISVEKEWLSTLIYSTELYQAFIRLQVLKKTLVMSPSLDGSREGQRGKPRKAL